MAQPTIQTKIVGSRPARAQPEANHAQITGSSHSGECHFTSQVAKPPAEAEGSECHGTTRPGHRGGAGQPNPRGSEGASAPAGAPTSAVTGAWGLLGRFAAAQLVEAKQRPEGFLGSKPAGALRSSARAARLTQAVPHHHTPGFGAALPQLQLREQTRAHADTSP